MAGEILLNSLEQEDSKQVHQIAPCTLSVYHTIYQNCKTLSEFFLRMGLSQNIEAALDWNIMENQKKYDGAVSKCWLFHIGVFMWNAAVSRIGVTRAASFVGIATVVSIISGVALLHESFSIIRVTGTVLIIAGVYAANIKT